MNPGLSGSKAAFLATSLWGPQVLQGSGEEGNDQF